MNLPERLRLVRKTLQLNQCEMADKLGIGTATIVRWEAGRNAPNMIVGEQLKNLLPGIRAEWLLCGKEPMYAPAELYDAIFVREIKTEGASVVISLELR